MRNLYRAAPLALLLLTLTRCPAFAEDEDPIVLTVDAAVDSVIVVGCTIGNGWSGFPTRMPMDYVSTSEQIHISLPLYVTWIRYGLHLTPQAVASTALTSFAWFTPAEIDSAETFDISILGPDGSHYTTCAAGKGLEAPVIGSYPLLNTNGHLQVEDTHGGNAVTTVILLRRQIVLPGTGGHTVTYLLYTGWTSPGMQTDAYTHQPVRLAPSGVPNGTYTWTKPIISVVGSTNYTTFCDLRVVQWVSADIAPASRGIVDASDLGVLANLYGHPVRWGWDIENPASSPNFQGNLNSSDDFVDASDLASYANDIHESCGLPKAGGEDDVMSIFAWFGFSPTGRTIPCGPNGETGPEYVMTSPAQLTIATQDPYGYRAHLTATQRIPWSAAKVLYR